MKVDIILEKIVKWLRNPYNLSLVAIVFFAFFLRLALNDLGQPLWWDEAEYMLQAKHWAFGTPDTGWNVVRPVLFSFVNSIFYRLGAGEVFFRFFIFAFSLLGIVSLYLFGKKLFNEKAGLIGSFLLSVFYLDLFLSGRLLVEMPSLSLGILGMWLFWEGYFGKGVKWAVAGGIFLGLSFLMRYTGVLFIIIFLLYLIFTERHRFLMKKEIWWTAIGGVISVIPYLIWSTIRYGNPVHSLGVATAEKGAGSMGFVQFWIYLKGLPGQLGLILFIVFLAGLLLFLFKFVIGFDLFLERKEKTLDSGFFALLWLILPLIYFGFFFQIFEPRYILYSFPAIFLFIGNFLINITEWLGKNQKIVGIIIITGLLLISGYGQFKMGKDLIDSKKDSYLELKEAGLWLKENSRKDDLIFNNGVPQNTYYSERRTETVATNNENEFLNEIKQRKPNYLVLSIWEKSQDWLYTYPQKHPEVLRPVKAFVRQGETMPRAVIYAFL